MNYSVNLDITPGGMPPVLHMSQYDTDRQYTVNLKDGGSSYSLGTGATGKVKGFNGKACFEIEATASGSTVTFQLTDASTDQFGIFPVTLELTNDGETISPLCMIFDVQKAGYTNEQAASSPEFENAMEEAAQKYVLGMDLTARTALLDLLAHVAYIDQSGQDYYDALELALRAKLSYIVADYAQDHTVYTDDSLDSLKEGDELIVTAYYDDGSHIDLSDSQYTLSGTLHEGTSTITVTYAGKTDTISVVCTVNGWLYHFEQSTASAGSKDFNWSGSPEYHTGHDGEGYSYYNGNEIVESTSFTPPDLSGDFTMAWWQKCITADKKGQGISPFKVGTTSGTMSATGYGSPANVKSGWSVSRDTGVNKTTEGIRIFWSSDKFHIRCVTSNLNYGAVYNATPPSGFDATAWHHFAVTRKDNILRLFVDGEMIFSAEVTPALFFNTQVAFGAYYANAGDTSARAGSYLCDYDDLFIAEWCKWDSNFDASAIQY